MSADTTSSSADLYSDSCNTAIIVVFVLFSSLSVVINLFAVISIAKNSPICNCTLLVCLLSASEVLNAFACGATTLYSYLKTSENLENNSVLCNFYAWLYVAFRIMSTLIVTFFVSDRMLLSLKPSFYVKQWSSFRTRWIVSLSVFIVAATLASLPFVDSSYTPSPDGARFHCLFTYSESFAVFYIVFHVIQALMSFVAMPWVISHEEIVDARLSVLLVGEMVVYRKGNDVVQIRESLKINRLICAIMVLYYACALLFPLVLLLRFLNVNYPAVVGLLALQLPSYGSMFIPVVYGFTWKPYRRAYYASLSCFCPPQSKEVKTRRVHSVYNPAFRETRDYDANSILHTRGVSLHQSTSQFDMNSTVPSSSAPSDPIELDPSQLTTHPEPGSSRRRSEPLPRAKSFHDHYRYTPSKFQSIFEIIDALSDPNRRASDETLDLSDTEDSRIDSLSSSTHPSPLHLNDVSVQLETPDVFSGVNFSSVNVSSWPYNNKVVNKTRLESERPNSFKEFHFEGLYKKQDKDPSPTSGPIRFTDLRKAKPERRVEENEDEPKLVNENRLMKYLANESYVMSKDT